jgi:DNA-binding MarR family transcriptional regulator
VAGGGAPSRQNDPSKSKVHTPKRRRPKLDPKSKERLPESPASRGEAPRVTVGHPSIRRSEAAVPTLLGSLTRATNLLRHHFEDHNREHGIGTSEYLVMRAALLNPDASTAEIRRSLAILDPAFSDVIRRTAFRGYIVPKPYRGNGRTRKITLTLPGKMAFRIAAAIQRDLEANAGAGPWMDDTVERLDVMGRRLSIVPPAERYLDGLPVVTA